MKKLHLLLLVLLFTCSGWAKPSEQIMKDRMKSDLDVLRNAFDVHYAPKEWKFNYAQWDLDTEINKAKEKIQNTSPLTMKQYHRIIRDFFNSTQDYHVNVIFHSTESATLPFRVKGTNGKYFITHVDTEKLSSHVYSFKKGDEIVTFDGKPTQEAINDILLCEGKGTADTDIAKACFFLTTRTGKLGHVVPKGPIMIGVKNGNNDKIKNYQLIWNYTPEQITHGLKGTDEEKPLSKNLKMLIEKELLAKSMLSPMYELIQNLGAEGQDLMGSRESYIPELGKIWWKSDKSCPFHAYLYEADDRKLIGYIRIPHYSGFNSNVDEFGKIITYMQERSDALVIDQINNPGGLAFYCYALVSMLTEQPLHTPRHRMSITQSDVAFAVEGLKELEEIDTDQEAVAVFGDTFFGMPVTHQMVQFLIDYLNFIKDEWNAGRTLTQPHFLMSIDQINPHPTIRYTKPILMLINELDISAGDFVPAILQDNHRVTLMGTRTAGAGGYVTMSSFPNLYGIDMFSYTASIAERLDKNPIENLGVTPEISYVLTENDLRSGYHDYKTAINAAVKNLLAPATEAKN